MRLMAQRVGYARSLGLCRLLPLTAQAPMSAFHPNLPRPLPTHCGQSGWLLKLIVVGLDASQRDELIRAREVIKAQLDELQLRTAPYGHGNAQPPAFRG